MVDRPPSMLLNELINFFHKPNSLKRLRREDKEKFNNLLETRENLTSPADAKVELSHLYDQVMEDLQNGTPKIKRLAFEALDV